MYLNQKISKIEKYFLMVKLKFLRMGLRAMICIGSLTFGLRNLLNINAVFSSL